MNKQIGAFGEQFSHVQIGMNDIATQWRGELSELLILSKAISSEANEALASLATAIHAQVQSMSQKLESHLHYYRHDFYLRTQSFNEIIRKTFDIFGESLSEHDLDCSVDIDPQYDVFVPRRPLSISLLALIEHLGSLKNICAPDHTIRLNVSNTIDENGEVVYRFLLSDLKESDDVLKEYESSFFLTQLKTQSNAEVSQQFDEDGFSLYLCFINEANQ
jgi:hypothetical protein